MCSRVFNFLSFPICSSLPCCNCKTKLERQKETVKGKRTENAHIFRFQWHHRNICSWCSNSASIQSNWAVWVDRFSNTNQWESPFWNWGFASGPWTNRFLVKSTVYSSCMASCRKQKKCVCGIVDLQEKNAKLLENLIFQFGFVNFEQNFCKVFEILHMSFLVIVEITSSKLEVQIRPELIYQTVNGRSCAIHAKVFDFFAEFLNAIELKFKIKLIDFFSIT